MRPLHGNASRITSPSWRKPAGCWWISLTNYQGCGSLVFSCFVRQDKLLNKHSICQSFATPWHPRDFTVMPYAYKPGYLLFNISKMQTFWLMSSCIYYVAIVCSGATGELWKHCHDESLVIHLISIELSLRKEKNATRMKRMLRNGYLLQH